MSDNVLRERLRESIFSLFEETFERVQGQYLDRGTSLFETLATISAAEASRPVSPTCATLAAQVEHVGLYIDVLDDAMAGIDRGRVDWDHIWRTVHAVTPEEWEASTAHLRERYERVRARMRAFETWEGEDDIGGALNILVHTAYHLGEIRQALCTLKAAPEGNDAPQ